MEDLTFAVDKNNEIIEDEFNIDPHTFSAIWYGLDGYEVSDLKEKNYSDKVYDKGRGLKKHQETYKRGGSVF